MEKGENLADLGKRGASKGCRGIPLAKNRAKDPPGSSFVPRSHPPVRLLFALLAPLGLCGPVFSQTILYVDDGAPPGGNGLSWCTAFQDLQDALAAAQPQDLIKVAEGTYRPDRGTGDRTQSFHLKDDVSVLGGFAGCGAPDPEERDPGLHPTILSGPSDNVVVVDPSVGPSTVMDGFTISGGSGQRGGGIYCQGSPTIQNCTIRDNFASLSGGGLWNQGSLTLRSCSFLQNVSDRGGGFSNIGNGTMVQDCLFQGNYGGLGGYGVYNIGLTNFLRCRFLGNWEMGPGGVGGGVWNQGDSLFEECFFGGNCADEGGGVSTSGNPRFLKCTFLGNSAPGSRNGGVGGGIYSDAGNPYLENCLLQGNVASEPYNQTPGGVGGMAALGGLAQLLNCRFQENQSAGSVGGFSGSGKLVNCIFDRNATIPSGLYSDVNDVGAFYGSGELINCTFVGNTAVDNVGGLQVSPTTVLTNCILWNNQDQNGTGESSQIQGNPILNNCLVMGWTGSLGGVGNFDADPMFVEESIGDYHLLATSPCIDAGDAGAFSTPPAVDFEGDPRPSFHGFDVGADEFHRHLYVTGDLVPGGLVTVKFLGRPGSSPVRLAVGSAVLDPPRSTSRGDWYLSSIRSRKSFGPLPPNGLLTFPRRIPLNPQEAIPLQGQIGRWFTNLFEVEIQ